MQPRLTFFCELAADELNDLFAMEEVTKTLKQLRAAISLGILDFDTRRADLVKKLNLLGIPVTAWLLLPGEQGYWFSLDNAALAIERYDGFRTWTEQNGLHWDAIGLDIEPDIREVRNWASSRWKMVPTVLLRLLQARRLRQSRLLYHRLVEKMRKDGYAVESYIFPILVDERKAWSTLLQKGLGVVDIPTDREVLMLYSSFIRPNGPGALWSYGPEAEAIAVGSTGGGVDVGVNGMAPLDWNELARDLVHAWYWSNNIYVFSLEGCVRQGYLDKILTLDWSGPIIPPEQFTRRIQGWRATLQSTLWAGSHLTVALLLLAGVLLILAPLRKRFR